MIWAKKWYLPAETSDCRNHNKIIMDWQSSGVYPHTAMEKSSASWNKIDGHPAKE